MRSLREETETDGLQQASSKRVEPGEAENRLTPAATTATNFWKLRQTGPVGFLPENLPDKTCAGKII